MNEKTVKEMMDHFDDDNVKDLIKIFAEALEGRSILSSVMILSMVFSQLASQLPEGKHQDAAYDLFNDSSRKMLNTLNRTVGR